MSGIRGLYLRTECSLGWLQLDLISERRLMLQQRMPVSIFHMFAWHASRVKVNSALSSSSSRSIFGAFQGQIPLLGSHRFSPSPRWIFVSKGSWSNVDLCNFLVLKIHFLPHLALGFFKGRGILGIVILEPFNLSRITQMEAPKIGKT